MSEEPLTPPAKIKAGAATSALPLLAPGMLKAQASAVAAIHGFGAAPLGTMMLIGGGYPPMKLEVLKAKLPNLNPDACDPEKIYRRLLALSPKKSPIVEVITSASKKFPAETAEEHILLLKHLGAGEVHATESRDADFLANDKEFAARLRRADIVFFTGGDQEDLAKFFNNTEAYNIIRERFQTDRNFVLAGTSAGAMIMARKTINGNNKEVKGGCPPIIDGFAFLPIIVETHMNSSGREPHERRLLHAVNQHPDNIGIGLDNATAAIIRNNTVTPCGEGRVLLVHHNDITMEIEPGRQVALASFRNCEEIADMKLKAHCFIGDQGFPLGTFNRVPQTAGQLARWGAVEAAIHKLRQNLQLLVQDIPMPDNFIKPNIAAPAPAEKSAPAIPRP